jgi:hypothetical protein
MLQRENETLHTRIGLSLTCGIPLHGSESAEDVPISVQNHSQSVRVSVAAAVKVPTTKTVAAAAPRKSKLFFLEIFKKLRKVRNNRFSIPMEEQQEVQLMALVWAEQAPPLMWLSSALLLPILSLPLTHCEESQLGFDTQQHSCRLHLFDESLTPLLFEFFALTILAAPTAATVPSEAPRHRNRVFASVLPGIGTSLSVRQIPTPADRSVCS